MAKTRKIFPVSVLIAAVMATAGAADCPESIPAPDGVHELEGCFLPLPESAGMEEPLRWVVLAGLAGSPGAGRDGWRYGGRLAGLELWTGPGDSRIWRFPDGRLAAGILTGPGLQAVPAVSREPASGSSGVEEPETEFRVPEIHVPNVSVQQSNEIKDIVERTAWLPVGQPDSPAVWMVLDPDCPYCAEAIRDMADDLVNGRYHLRVVLTPFLSEHSVRQAAAVLLAEDPAKALFSHEYRKAFELETDLDLAGADRLQPEGHTLLLDNLRWMDSAGIASVPTFFWVDRAGRWHQAEGLPVPRVQFTRDARRRGDWDFEPDNNRMIRFRAQLAASVPKMPTVSRKDE